MPSILEIVTAQAELVHSIQDLPCEQASNACWACLFYSPSFIPARAHIDGTSNGGDNDPANFLLLCDICHRQHPDGAAREDQIAWLMSHETVFAWFCREWGPIVSEIHAAAIRAGDENLMNTWRESVGVDGLRAAYASGADMSCASSLDTQFANGRRGVVAAFKAWLAKRPARAATKQMDLFGVSCG